MNGSNFIIGIIHGREQERNILAQKYADAKEEIENTITEGYCATSNKVIKNRIFTILDKHFGKEISRKKIESAVEEEMRLPNMIYREALEKKKQEGECKAESLCDSCGNKACELQSGIVRKHCDFYKPVFLSQWYGEPMPRTEIDNCGNIYTMSVSNGKEYECKAEDCISREYLRESMIEYGWSHPDSTVTEYVEGLPSAYPKSETEQELRNKTYLTMREITPEEREAMNKVIRDMSYDTGVTLQGLLNHEKYVPVSVLNDIKAELNELKSHYMPSSGVEWGMKIACEIIDKHSESEDKE